MFHRNKPMFPSRTVLFCHFYFFLVNNFSKSKLIHSKLIHSKVNQPAITKVRKLYSILFEKLIRRVPWHQRYVFWALSFWDRTQFASQLGLDFRRSNFSHLFIFWAVPWLIYSLSWVLNPISIPTLESFNFRKNAILSDYRELGNIWIKLQGTLQVQGIIRLRGWTILLYTQSLILKKQQHNK